MAVRHLVTAEELERMGEQENGWDYELVRGELVRVMAAGRQHGVLTGFLVFDLTSFVRQHGLGRVYTDGLGYKLFTNPDTVRVPDVSFVSREREPGLRGVRGFIKGAPDLAVEVVSRDNTLPELTAKGQEYLEAGARLVWIVDGDARAAYVMEPGAPRVRLTAADRLEGSDLLPGFALSLERLFAELD
jgi:Uma2 family endonuclease